MFTKTFYKNIFALLIFSIGLEFTIHNYNQQFISIFGILLMAFGFYNLFIKNNREIISFFRRVFNFNHTTNKVKNPLSEELKWLDQNRFSYFHEFYIDYDNLSFLMDTIIISNCYIFNLASKDYSGSIEIDAEGNWIHKDSAGDIGIESPLTQIKKQRILLEKIYQNSHNIVDIIVLTNQECILNGKNNCQVPIIRLDALLNFLDQYENETLISSNLCNAVNIEKFIVPKIDNSILYRFKGFINLLKNRKVIFLGITILTLVISFIIIQPFGGSKANTTQGNPYDQTSNEPTKNVQTTPTLIFLNDCTTTALNKKVKIIAKSIEKNIDNTILNISVENNYGKDIALFGTEKIKLTDDSGNIYSLKPIKSTNLFDSIPTDSVGDIKMVFDGITHPYKKINLTGEFWTLDLGASDTAFAIPILY